MKKVLSIMLAVLLIITAVPVTVLATGILGDANGDGKLNTLDARYILQALVDLRTIDDVASVDMDGNGKLGVLDARLVLQAVAGLGMEEPNPDTPDLTKAELVALFNSETAKAAKGSYSWSRVCEFTEDGAIDVGNATATLNQIIQMIDANATLDSVVGAFVGIGDATGTVTDGECPDGMNEQYMLKAMSLTEEDVKEYKVEENQYTLLLTNCDNPQRDNKNALHHATDDFFTEQDVKDALSSVTTAITVGGADVEYSDIMLVAKLENGKPVSLEISYVFDAELNLSVASMNMKGSGKARNILTYTDFNY